MTEPFAKGKRGIISLEVRDGMRVAIKEKRPESKAVDRIAIEASWLQKLNEQGIGPKYVAFEKGKLVREFIGGEMIEEYVSKHEAVSIIKVLVDVMEQCFTMDQTGVNKEEMHHPVKHIIIREEKPYLIDFERCHATEKPKNVTQFVQFLTSTAFGGMLKEKGIKLDADRMRRLAEEYKDDPKRNTFETILAELD